MTGSDQFQGLWRKVSAFRADRSWFQRLQPAFKKAEGDAALNCCSTLPLLDPRAPSGAAKAVPFQNAVYATYLIQDL